MVRITPHRHRASFARPNQHSAANGAVAAGRRRPPVRHPRCRDVTELRVFGISVAVRQRVQPDQALEVHAASLWKKDAAMFFGTNETKNRYRESNSAASEKPKPDTNWPVSGRMTPPPISSISRSRKRPRRSFASSRAEA